MTTSYGTPARGQREAFTSRKDAEAAVIQDTARAVADTLKLTDVGRTYVERFCRYLLKCHGRAEPEDVKRPKFSGPHTQGRVIRQAVHVELNKQLRSAGRSELKLEAGVMVDDRGRSL